MRTIHWTYDIVRINTTGQGDDYPTGCLLDYPSFQKYYKVIATDLSKRQGLDADPKVIQQINFTGNLNWPGIATILFFTEEVKKDFCDFSQESVRVL